MRLMFGVYTTVRMYASYNIPMYVRRIVVVVGKLISLITVPTSDVYWNFIVKNFLTAFLLQGKVRRGDLVGDAIRDSFLKWDFSIDAAERIRGA